MDHQGRIYALHDKLRRSRHPASTAQLCDLLACTPATLRRLVQQMRDEYRAPIESRRHDGGGYWYAEDERERYELPGLWFSPDELLALVACLELLDNIEPGVLAPKLEPLRQRLNMLLEKKCNGAATEIRRIRILGLATRIKRPEIFRIVAEAVLARGRLAFRYHARQDGQKSERKVSPQRLTHYRDNWYLDAWDHGRKALRIFSLDRIDALHRLPERARGVPESQLNRELAAGYGIFAGAATQTAVLRFNAERARWVADEQWHPRQKGRYLDDGRYELRIPYADARELIMDILKYGPDAEVAAPVALRREVATRLRAAARQYESWAPGLARAEWRSLRRCGGKCYNGGVHSVYRSQLSVQMNAYQIKIELSFISPLVWRRLRVPIDITLAQLHAINQIAMGWDNAHLHLFSIKGEEYGLHDPGLGGSVMDERKAILGELVSPGDNFVYVYDFGDDWGHKIEVEKAVQADAQSPLPCCVGGARACPPEDCGGPPGYAMLLEALANPEAPENAERLEWLGGGFDPEAFNAQAVNKYLRRL